MRLKDVKRLKWLKRNPKITIEGQEYTYELKMDQDKNWTINFIKVRKDSND